LATTKARIAVIATTINRRIFVTTRTKIATMSTETISTTTATTGSSSLTRDDQKYGKRRHEKQRQQRHRAMALVGVTCVVLAFTWYSLSNIIPPPKHKPMTSALTMRHGNQI
jgi:hypothetical protein